MKRILAILITIITLFSVLMPINVSADTNEKPNYTKGVKSYDELESRLNSLIKKYNNTNWTKNGRPSSNYLDSKYYHGWQCKGFAGYIFNDLFCGGYIGTYDSNMYYIPSPHGAKLVEKKWNLGSKDTKTVKSIISKGHKGDFIQVRRRGKSWGHSMILVDFDDKGLTIFDCNSDGKCGVKKYYQTYATFASKNSGMSLYHSTKYPAIKPSKPTITNCNATGATSIKVEWDKVSGASKYKIVRHEVDGANKKTLTDKCTSTSYTDKGLISGHTYYYIVYAYGNNKWSDASTEWKTYTAPATPKQPEINRDVPKQLTITWNKVDGATKYKLEYHRADTSGWTTLDSNIKTTSYTHKNLADGTKYNYRVTAIREGNIGRADKKKNQKVESGASPTKTKFTQMARPSNSANNDNTSQVVLKWNAVKGSKGYSYAYNVYRDGAKINSSLVTGTTYTDNKAVSGKIHNYQIEIMEKSDTSKTYIGRGKTALYAGSKITKEISVVPQSSTEMKISWAAPASAPSGTKYTIQKYDFTKNEYFKYAETNNTYFVDKNLKAGETYRYYIQVRDKDGNYLTSTFGTAAKLDIAASKITLNKSEVSLNEGETVNLTATITPENCFDKTVRWASLNEGVASVDANGLVTAKTAGTAEITATTSNNQTAKCVVTVNSKECTHEYEGENEGWIIDTAATCEEAGSRHRVCKKCSETETETIAATGHQYSEEYQTVKEATCTEAGEQAHVCSVCNAQIDNIPIEATGHKFGDTWLVEKGATCDEQGIEYRQCSVCGERETRDIDTTTHDYELTEKTDVTPDGPGHITYTCKICGESYTEEYVPEINEGTISIGDGSLKAGGTITLPVTIENNPGIAGFNFTLDYDKSVMTPTAITKGGLIPEGTTFTSNLEQGIPASELKEVSVYWGASSNVTEDGELFNITFDVTGGTTDGLYPISLKYEKGDITDAAFNDVMPTIIDNVVTIADVMRGDVNLDRRVDSQDELLLSRYIAKWNLEFNDNQKKAANVFADSAGTINSKDGVRLSQILSGYELIDSGEAASLMASKEVDISLGEAEVTAGDYISVPVMITGNEGIAGFNFTLNYDKEYLTPVAIEKGEMLVDGNFTSNLTEETDGSSLDYVTAYWNCAYDMVEDGELFSVDFIVSDNTIVGQQLPIEISCEDGSLCDYTLSDVSVTLTQDNLNVIEDIQEDPIDEIELMPYEIANVSMTLNDGTICEEIPSNGDFNLDVLLFGTTENFNPATMMIGLYDDNGSLINMQYDNITEEMISSDENFNIHIDETYAKIKDIKIFVWNSTNELEPLSDIFELVNQESN